ncbi:MAG: ATP-binding protein [Acetatifactor sp.]
MKKKINRTLVLISVLAIVLTTGLITVVYYSLFHSQVMADLKDCSGILGEAVDAGAGLEQIGEGMAAQDIRVTLVDFQGYVLYDNEVSSDTLENHLDRPEIRDALATGEGESMRNSETLARNTFYYAVRTQDGNVLRVAKDAGSIYSIFSSVMPTILWILAALILLSFGMAHFLTHKLVVPIENLAENMEKYVDAAEYEELAPFITMIQEQHKDILRNAQMRQEFTANVSHELKTPLTSISGYAELIETGMASEEDVVRFAHGIRSSSQRLLTLINDIIRLSELDSGEMEAPFEDLNLYELAGTCVEMLRMSAEKHKVNITLGGYECHIHGNKQMIEELLYNLCDNAIRYNNEGGQVEVQVYKETSADRRTVLAVKDTGIGIPKEHQDRIFERFYRVDKSRSKSTGGTGLGLAIVKHIVAKHGAKMELQSEVGKGTEIKVLFG